MDILKSIGSYAQWVQVILFSVNRLDLQKTVIFHGKRSNLGPLHINLQHLSLSI